MVVRLLVTISQPRPMAAGDRPTAGNPRWPVGCGQTHRLRPNIGRARLIQDVDAGEMCQRGEVSPRWKLEFLSKNRPSGESERSRPLGYGCFALAARRQLKSPIHEILAEVQPRAGSGVGVGAGDRAQNGREPRLAEGNARRVSISRIRGRPPVAWGVFRAMWGLV